MRAGLVLLIAVGGLVLAAALTALALFIAQAMA